MDVPAALRYAKPAAEVPPGVITELFARFPEAP